jgi:hypothetical protein
VHDALAAGGRVEEEAHPSEVDLALLARLAIGDPHCRTLTAGAAAHLGDVALHRARRHRQALALQQLGDLHARQVVGDPRRHRLVVVLQHPPCLTMTVGAMRTHRLHHQTEEHVAQLLVPVIADQAKADSGIHVAAHGLAIHTGQPLCHSDALAGQPQPQHLSNLEHSDLPERHRRLPAR